MDSYGGASDRNPLYFQHADIATMQIQINGVIAYNINATFPHQASQAYFESLQALGLTYNHLLECDAFTSGRTLWCFDFSNETLADAIPLEKSGHFRLSLSMHSGLDRNRLILIFGENLGGYQCFGRSQCSLRCQDIDNTVFRR